MSNCTPEFSDTDPRVMEVWLTVLRQKTPDERLQMTLDMTAFALQLAEAGGRARYPEASEREIFLRCAAAARAASFPAHLSVALEILHFPLVLLRLLARRKSPEIAPLARLRIGLT